MESVNDALKNDQGERDEESQSRDLFRTRPLNEIHRSGVPDMTRRPIKNGVGLFGQQASPSQSTNLDPLDIASTVSEAISMTAMPPRMMGSNSRPLSMVSDQHRMSPPLDITRINTTALSIHSSPPLVRYSADRVIVPSSAGMLPFGQNSMLSPTNKGITGAVVNKAHRKDNYELDMILPFPVKLHYILSTSKYQDYIDWLPHGRSWRILKTEAFEKEVIPKFFRSAKIASFMRQVSSTILRHLAS
jgi:hypothetical protein